MAEVELRRHVRRPVAVAAAVVIASGAGASSAGAHATLLETSPAPGARLADPPSRISLLYTEPLNERLTTVRLTEVGGEPVPVSTRVTGSRRLQVIPRAELPQGAYRLTWRSVSTIDGHIREGSVGFGVGTSAGAAVDIEASPLGGIGTARVVARWLFYAALFVFAGGVFNAVLLGRGRPLGAWLLPDGLDDRTSQVAERATARIVLVGWLAAAGAAAVVAVETLDAAGAGWGGVRDFLLSGSSGTARLVLVAAMLVAAAVARRSTTAAALAVAVALVAIAQGGHAAGASPAGLAVLTDWVHLVAAALWIGGLSLIAWTWLPTLRTGPAELRRDVLRSVFARFGRIALPAFLVVALTGSVNALLQLGAPDEIWNSGYGRVLLAKIVLVATVALLSYLHAVRLRPRLLAEASDDAPQSRRERSHRRLLTAEIPTAVTVVALAALLVGFPVPPRESRLAEARSAVPTCDPCPFARPRPGELSVAAPVGRLTAAVWMTRSPGELTGTLRIIDGKRRPAAARARVTGARSQRACGVGCWRFSVPHAGAILGVSVDDEGQRRALGLPARWSPEDDTRARRILARAQRAMRDLESFRQVETVVSAAGAGSRGRVEFRFRSPDRMAYRARGGESVVIGARTWIRPSSAAGWQVLDPAEEEFRVRDGFRWTVFASTARLLSVRDAGGRRLAELALVDWGYPVWYRVTIDLATGRVVRQSLVTPENRIDDRYFAYDRPLRIKAPRAASANRP